MTARDSRLDDGVKVARRATWISEDPNPEYSRLDNLDGLRPFTADIVLPRPVRAVQPLTDERVLPDHTMFEAMRVLFWIVAIGVPTVVVFTVGFMVGRWVA